jgi:hypothetical protein
VSLFVHNNLVSCPSLHRRISLQQRDLEPPLALSRHLFFSLTVGAMAFLLTMYRILNHQPTAAQPAVSCLLQSCTTVANTRGRMSSAYSMAYVWHIVCIGRPSSDPLPDKTVALVRVSYHPSYPTRAIASVPTRATISISSSPPVYLPSAPSSPSTPSIHTRFEQPARQFSIKRLVEVYM